MKVSLLWLFACSLCASAGDPLTVVTKTIPYGFVGKPYTLQLEASGGVPPYRWLTWDSRGVVCEATGLVHGTATYPFSVGPVRVFDSTGNYATGNENWNFFDPVERIDGLLPPAAVNASYFFEHFKHANTSTLISGALPPGISAANALYGRPIQAGIFTFTLMGTGYGGDTVTQAFTLTVAGPISIALQPTYALTIGQSATIPWAISGGVPPYNISLEGQPDGMSPTSGSTGLSGTPSRVGVFNVRVSVLDQVGTRQYAATTVTVAAPLSAVAVAASARQNNSFSTSLSATGGQLPYSWRVTSGVPPTGLSLASDGKIAGVVAGVPGVYPFTATVTDSRSATAATSVTLTVTGPVIGAPVLPHAQVGSLYSQTLSMNGGSPSYTWSVFSGSLPAGITLDRNTGTIGGTPSVAGSYTFTARVADAFGSYSAANLSLTVDAPHLSLSNQTLPAGNVGTPYRFALVPAGGVAPFQFALENGTLPDGLTADASGVFSGTPARKGNWVFAIRVTDSERQTARASLTFQALGAVPKLSAASVLNAASFLGGLAPGTYFSIFGENLATATAAAATFPLPVTLGTATVQWNGVAVPLMAVSPNQINAQVPFEAGQGPAKVTVTADGVTGPAATVTLQPSAPGIFQLLPGLVLAINEDGNLNSSDHPAPAGSVIVFYATGCGAYDTQLTTGSDTPTDRLFRLALPSSLLVGGETAEILFAGAAPGLGSGLVQVNARVPSVAQGEWPIRLTVGGQVSNSPHVFMSRASN